MKLEVIVEQVNECKVVTDIYSGNHVCQCGKRLSFTDLQLGGFGTSLACSCGDRFWIASEDEDEEEILVYEGYDYIIDEYFTILKQKVFTGIDWTTRKIDANKIRQENECLYIIFPNKTSINIEQQQKMVFEYFDDKGKLSEERRTEFFNNINLEDMERISEAIENYCIQKDIVPNYGILLKSLISANNVVNFESILQSVVNDYYIEALLKDGLEYLFSHGFLFSKYLLENNANIDKTATSSSEILGVPKKVIGYIREKRLSGYEISLLQSFFEDNTVMDFEILTAQPDSLFEIRDLPDLNRLLKYGYTSHKLNKYAKEIIVEENLRKHDFLMLLCDSLKMSRAINIEFKLYGKNLRERHDEITAKYKLVKNSGLNHSLENIKRNTDIKQTGNKYIAVVPGSVYDFQVEATNQRHCVLSYTENMASGETLIVFIRYKEEPSKSHITLEVRNKRIVQAKGFANQAIDEEDKEYLKELAKLNKWQFYF